MAGDVQKTPSDSNMDAFMRGYKRGAYRSSARALTQSPPALLYTTEFEGARTKVRRFRKPDRSRRRAKQSQLLRSFTTASKRLESLGSVGPLLPTPLSKNG